MEEIALRPGGVLASRIGARRLLGLKLERAWAAAVGNGVRAVTRLRQCRDGILEVQVPDAAWQRELGRLEAEILGRLATELSPGQVTQLRFKVQHSIRAPQASIVADRRPVPTSVGTSHPGELSDRFRSVMGRYLLRSRAE